MPTHIHPLLFVRRDIRGGGQRYTTKSTCHALVAPLIFFLLFFVFLRPITKARPPRRPPLPFSPFLFLSFLTRRPSFLHAWHETSLWWSPARNVHGGPIYRDRERRSLFTFGLNDRARTRALSSPPSPSCSLFFHVPALRARCRNVFFRTGNT